MQLKVLMLAGLSGDAEAHRQLLAAAASRLRSYFGRRIGSDAADVEDLVQETLIAIHSFTKSLALSLGKRSIRVNCVIPGPVWTPNIPGTMPPDEVENFGHEVALGRPGQPEKLVPAYVLLASSDGSFMTGLWSR